MFDINIININQTNKQHSRILKIQILETIIMKLFNFTLTSVILCFVLSWLIPIISIIVWSTSPGPIFFVQLRTGQNGRVFKCLKFRTMYCDGIKEFKQAQQNDPRVTPIGRWLRKSSLDEIPQFINVLIGNMYIIGPRPHPITLDAQFCYVFPNYLQRYQIQPGITGLAQARGARGNTDNPIKMKQRLKYDMFYISHKSLKLDLAITWWTIISLFMGNKNAF